MYQLATLLEIAAGELRGLAVRFDKRLARRRHAADALAILREMSDRELKDIGLTRAELQAVATGKLVRDFERVF